MAAGNRTAPEAVETRTEIVTGAEVEIIEIIGTETAVGAVAAVEVADDVTIAATGTDVRKLRRSVRSGRKFSQC